MSGKTFMRSVAVALSALAGVCVAAHAQQAAAAGEPAQSAASAPEARYAPTLVDALTIGQLAAIQAQTLAADAAKRAGIVSTPAPVQTVAVAKPPAPPPRQARLVSIVTRSGNVLFSEWEDDSGVVRQLKVGDKLLGWVLRELEPQAATMTSPGQSVSIVVGGGLRERTAGRRAPRADAAVDASREPAAQVAATGDTGRQSRSKVPQ